MHGRRGATPLSACPGMPHWAGTFRLPSSLARGAQTLLLAPAQFRRARPIRLYRVGGWAMRPSPSIVPGVDRDTYLVLDDFGGHLSLAWRETEVEDTDLETVIGDLLQGQYCNPVRIVGFNISAGWVRDVSQDVAL